MKKKERRKYKNDEFGSMVALAHEKIKNLIMTGKLSPGQKIIYSDLEKELNMSKSPIINALNKLESQGYVYLKKNAGYSVKEVKFNDIIQVLEAREVLEIANLDCIIKENIKSSLENLNKCLLDYKNYKPEYYDRKMSILNSNLHVQIAKLSRNQFLIRYIESIYEWIDLRVIFRFMPSDIIEEMTIEHEQVIDAIANEDIEMAKKLLRTHLHKISTLMIEKIKKELTFLNINLEE